LTERNDKKVQKLIKEKKEISEKINFQKHQLILIETKKNLIKKDLNELINEERIVIELYEEKERNEKVSSYINSVTFKTKKVYSLIQKFR
jgi:c-di-GMP-related signal transduction protein